jgi:hypothetical protein
MKKIVFLMFCFASLITHAQTISGVVKNSSNSPIVYALVCQTNNPTIYTKTNAKGEFTITGNSTTNFKVAALGYETKLATKGALITLQNDAVLNADVKYHISFDHLRKGNSYTDTELKNDFRCAYGKGVSDGSAGSDRTSVDYDVSRDLGGVSLKVKFPKGKLKTESSGIDTRIPLSNTYKDNTFESRDLYISYWIKFSDNFDFTKCGGKLPSLGGSTPGTRDENRWKGRIMWRKGGAIQFYMELPDNSFNAEDGQRFWGEKTKQGSGICEFEYQSYLGQPGWHNIELHYKFETPGKNDGYFEGWVDGVNHAFMDATVFNNYLEPNTSRANITTNYLLLSAFLGGSDLQDYAPTEDQYAWFDEFKVSTKRVNEFNKYNAVNNKLNLEEEKLTTIESLKAYPNPSTGLFTLTEEVEWRVFNFSGDFVKKGTSTTVDLTNHTKGLYFLKTTNGTNIKLLVE